RHETPGEGDTVDEVHALTGRGEAEGIAKYTLGRMPPPVWCELRGGEESLEGGPGHDSHPEERRLPILRSHHHAQAEGAGPGSGGCRCAGALMWRRWWEKVRRSAACGSTDRGPVPAWGSWPWISQISVPGTNWSAVSCSRNDTISGALRRKASVRSSS